MTTKTRLQRAVEKATGEKVDDIRAMTISDRRKMIEKNNDKMMKVKSLFPIIGRGNVLGNRCASREKINSDLDKALNR